MATLADALRVLNELEHEGVIETYAIGGAMAMLFWAEPTVTFDLDVFVLLPGQAEVPIVSLESLYQALRDRGFEPVAEHVIIHGTPVQFRVSPNALADEAIATAAAQELDGVPFRVMRPEHLAAFWLQAGGAKRRERVELLRQAGVVDESTLADLLTRHPRPSEALVAAQRAGKAQWRRDMAARPFKEKVRLLLEMQRRLYPVIAARRALQIWQRPWLIDG